MIKFDDSNFMQCWHHLKLIIEGFDLTGYVDDTLPVSPRFVLVQKGKLILNFEFVVFHQQDKLLASCMLSTISNPSLTCFTSANLAHGVWSTAYRMFVAIFGTKISRLKHELQFLKKGALNSYIIYCQDKKYICSSGCVWTVDF